MLKRMLFLVVSILITSSVFAAGGNPFYVCATNAIKKAAEAGRCRWSKSCGLELWNDDILQDELAAELSKRVPDAYAEAKSCAGNMHNPKLNAIQSDFCFALRNAPTVKRIADYAVDCGFSPDVQVAVEKFEFIVRPDGRRCFRGIVGCRSFMTRRGAEGDGRCFPSADARNQRLGNGKLERARRKLLLLSLLHGN